MLRSRLLAAIEAAKANPLVDASRVAVIGFCFGGLCALDVARAVVPEVKGVVSFHGLFMPPELGPQPPITSGVGAPWV
ncbi:MAG: dienelactone hydrolase family protein [Vampirovibrionales bacterium]